MRCKCGPGDFCSCDYECECRQRDEHQFFEDAGRVNVSQYAPRTPMECACGHAKSSHKNKRNHCNWCECPRYGLREDRGGPLSQPLQEVNRA